MAERVKQRPSKARGRPPLADDDLVDEIKAIISEMPTYGYRGVHAILRRKARSEGRPWPNAKRVYR
ncbi:putative transposase [Rhizobium tibeticum]|uniref:Transposase n=1 Tax=Rhizobium tibeticum TaxID=501024 RepID=A0A1H8XE76_9HYPH|nr:insertion element IS2 transposase InsD [Rhizobium tibeticum]SEP38196.1 putative transposase [Rhizobium tibeticum]